jgi:hypothetical protein
MEKPSVVLLHCSGSSGAQWRAQGAGHMLPITHRDEVNALVAAHIDANAFPVRRAASREPAAAIH